jgi:hypothetical protein
MGSIGNRDNEAPWKERERRQLKLKKDRRSQ